MSSTTAINGSLPADAAERDKINLSESDWIQVLNNLSPSSMNSLQETLKRLKDTNNVNVGTPPQSAFAAISLGSQSPLSSLQVPTLLAPSQSVITTNGQSFIVLASPQKTVAASTPVKPVTQPLFATALPLVSTISPDKAEADLSFNSLNALATAAALQAATEVTSEPWLLSFSCYQAVVKKDPLVVISSDEKESASNASVSPVKIPQTRSVIKQPTEESVRTTRRTAAAKMKAVESEAPVHTRKRNHTSQSATSTDGDSQYEDCKRAANLSTPPMTPNSSVASLLVTMKNGTPVPFDQNQQHVGREHIEDEDARRKKRRERNRVAAAKCRQRRQDQIGQFQKQVTSLYSVGEKLRHELKSVYDERIRLEAIVQQHTVSSYSPVATSITSLANLLSIRSAFFPIGSADSGCGQVLALNEIPGVVEEMIAGYLPTLDKILVDDKFVPRNRKDGSKLKIESDEDDSDSESKNQDSLASNSVRPAIDEEQDVDIEGSASSSLNMVPDIDAQLRNAKGLAQEPPSVTLVAPQKISKVALSSANRPTSLPCNVVTPNLFGPTAFSNLTKAGTPTANILQQLTNRMFNPVTSSPSNSIWSSVMNGTTSMTPDRADICGKALMTPTLQAPTTPLYAITNQKFGLSGSPLLFSPSQTAPQGVLTSVGGQEAAVQLIRMSMNPNSTASSSPKPT
ncbi:hypothetical protein Ciccas_008156 [Cichlidogyrus casuarinus]|uniref:BZIP domain-containing protein n=1 Tax=Cichlidogyrus casuarinus TaxID=1844966 RepID=A0ABD2Q1K2_9PLAT